MEQRLVLQDVAASKKMEFHIRNEPSALKNVSLQNVILKMLHVHLTSFDTERKRTLRNRVRLHLMLKERSRKTFSSEKQRLESRC